MGNKDAPLLLWLNIDSTAIHPFIQRCLHPSNTRRRMNFKMNSSLVPVIDSFKRKSRSITITITITGYRVLRGKRGKARVRGKRSEAGSKNWRMNKLIDFQIFGPKKGISFGIPRFDRLKVRENERRKGDHVIWWGVLPSLPQHLIWRSLFSLHFDLSWFYYFSEYVYRIILHDLYFQTF